MWQRSILTNIQDSLNDFKDDSWTIQDWQLMSQSSSISSFISWKGIHERRKYPRRDCRQIQMAVLHHPNWSYRDMKCFLKWKKNRESDEQEEKWVRINQVWLIWYPDKIKWHLISLRSWETKKKETTGLPLIGMFCERQFFFRCDTVLVLHLLFQSTDGVSHLLMTTISLMSLHQETHHPLVMSQGIRASHS